MTPKISFIDSEIATKPERIVDLGAVKNDGATFHAASTSQFPNFIKGSDFIVGHNIVRHDLKYLGPLLTDAQVDTENVIDTLYLSPLLFPSRPYHNLVKDDKLQRDELNNPLNDAKKAKELFDDECSAFAVLDEQLKHIFFLLLRNSPGFAPFFKVVNFQPALQEVESLIREYFKENLCDQALIGTYCTNNPVELAYSLSLIHTHDKYSITPPWVLRNFPATTNIMLRLRGTPCMRGCNYCNAQLDVYKGLKSFFGYESFRVYDGEPLQEKAVRAAMDNKSLLAVFPTGGGKSLTFQLPALIAGEATKGLTVVISPLQSLMKDQVDNLFHAGVVDAVTINGLLNDVERKDALTRVAEGTATILYIAPELLRSKTIENLLLGRKIARFVIDEAHCFSAWGQDFRVDYLYIGDFIRTLLEKKNLTEPIPVSCLTATAKQKVIEDIRQYFKDKLGLELELFTSKASRKNLLFRVMERNEEDEKYNTVKELLEENPSPTIIYVSRTATAELLAGRLAGNGFSAKPFHGKMDVQDKVENQNGFMQGTINIIVATSAFGMGVDKKDVGMVIHYEISDSLENYIQEAGRAGRDEAMTAECYVLFNEEDLSKHFIMLNQTKLSIKEVQQVWKAIKEITRFRDKASNSALEIARKAGWDEGIMEIETRVTTAIAALEDAGYIKRGQNMPRVFANSIQSRTAQEAIDKIMVSEKFNEKQKEKATRIIKKLFSAKRRIQEDEEVAESRVDYISDHLAIAKEEVIGIVNLLREEKILADAKDLTAFIRRSESRNKSLKLVEEFAKVEAFLLSQFQEEEEKFSIKELNEAAETSGCTGVTPARVKTLINFWAIRNWIKRHHPEYSRNFVGIICSIPKLELKDKLAKRHQLASFIVTRLFERSVEVDPIETREEVLVEFSVHELKEAYQQGMQLFESEVTIDEIEDALFYLSRIEAIRIEGGFLILYNQLTLERLESNNKKQYTKDDYGKLKQYYDQRVQQIHIVGEYAKKMIDDYKSALQFVEDYFQLNYSSFINKYFKGTREDDIRLNLTPGKFKQLFGELSATQLKIVNDRDTKYMITAAGPGSGKTKVLVHKLASLLLMEDVKQEQLLMVTFSRAAANEFKKRLMKLIGNAAHFVEIKTFHSYCFDLLGKVGNVEKSETIVQQAVEQIRAGAIEASRITRTVLVIDEAQDMNQHEYELIKALINYNEEMRVIAVGDDDQNIYEFRGSSSKHLWSFLYDYQATKHELLENYRSKSNLVSFTNQFLQTIGNRLKENPIVAFQRDSGKIKVFRYQSPHFITPLVNDILETSLTGSTCVLTNTNEEAVQVAGLLLRNNVKARLIQSNDGFSLYNLVEIRYFLEMLSTNGAEPVIQDDTWDNAKKHLLNKFRHSTKLDLCQNIIREFELLNPKKRYKADLKEYLLESELESFYTQTSDVIFVSTIHKAKGKEFDNIFVLLQNTISSDDATGRKTYVAFTRAKSLLHIHLKGNYLDNYLADGLEYITDTAQHEEPNEIAKHLTLRDIILDFCLDKQPIIEMLIPGDSVHVEGNVCLTSNHQPVIKFSAKLQQEIAGLAAKGYKVKGGTVNFVLYWTKQTTGQEVKIMLPELFFTKR